MLYSHPLGFARSYSFLPSAAHPAANHFAPLPERLSQEYFSQMCAEFWLDFYCKHPISLLYINSRWLLYSLFFFSKLRPKIDLLRQNHESCFLVLALVPSKFPTQRITIRQNQNAKQDALKDNKIEGEIQEENDNSVSSFSHKWHYP